METVTVGEMEIPLPNYEVAAEWFRRYKVMGFSPVHWTVDPARTGKKYGNDGKGPRIRDWNLMEYAEPPPCERQYQMGLMTGKEIVIDGRRTGRYLVCVDIDDPGLQADIEASLPETPLKGGKEKTPKSHLLYSVEAKMSSFTWLGRRADGTEGCLLEILSVHNNKGTSQQVVVAPSRHYDTATDIGFYGKDGFLEPMAIQPPAEVSAKTLYDACVFALKKAYPGGDFRLKNGKGMPILWDRPDCELLALEKAARMNSDDEGRPKAEAFDDKDARRTIDHAVWELEKVEPGNVQTAMNALVFTAASIIAGSAGSSAAAYLKELGDRCLECYDTVCDRYPESKQSLEKWEYTINRAIEQGVACPRRRGVLQAYRMTDAGTTELLSDEWRSSYRFCTSVSTDSGGTKSGNGEWYCWDGKRWEQTTVDQVICDSKHVMRWAAAEAATSEDKMFRSNATKYYYKAENKGKAGAAVSGLKAWLGRGGLAVPRDALDADPWILSCGNGTFDIRAGELRDFRRDDLCTKATPFKYVKGAKPPAKLMDSLRKAFESQPDPEACVRYLLRWFGYLATGDTSEQKLLILHGGGRNGKTALLEKVVGKALGDYMGLIAKDVLVAQERKNTSGPSPEIVDLRGMRYGLYSESEPGEFLNEGRIKQLTGSESIKARQMYGTLFSFKTTCKFIIDTNYLPKIRGSDFGILRRLRPVPFMRQLPEEEQDKFFAEKLMEAHGDAVLTMILDEAHAYFKEGLLPEPECVKKEMTAFAEDNDVIGCFLDECCDTDEAAKWAQFDAESGDPLARSLVGDFGLQNVKLSEFRIGADELYQAYKKWAFDGGYTPLNRKNFNMKLKERGWAQPPRTRTGFVWNGLRLKPAAPALG